MEYRQLGQYVSLNQGLAINAGTAHLVSKTKNDEFVYPLLRIADMVSGEYEKYISCKVNPSVIAQKDDIIYTRTGQVGLVFRGYYGVVHNNSFIVSLQSDNLSKDYLYAVLNSDFVRKQALSLAKNSAQPDLTHDMFKSIVIPVPTKKKQIEVAAVYNFLSQKIEENTAVNDNLQQELCLIYEHIMSQSKKGLILGTHTIASELSEITTGREDANFADTNGKYKFFTCSSETLKCNHYAFNSSSILIAGNGEFNVKHFSGKFNAYQRTYVLTPKQEHYGLLYLACLYQIKSFKSSSAGSIVKFITKGDIDNIPVFIPDDGTYLIQMNKLLDLQEMRLRENEKLLALRDFLLPLLMNGQATIAE